MGKVSKSRHTMKGDKIMAKEIIKATTGLEVMPTDTKGYEVIPNTNKKVKGDFAIVTEVEVDIDKAFKAMSEENLFKAFKRDYVIDAQGIMRDKVKTELGLKTTKDKTPTAKVVETLQSMVDDNTITREQMDDSLGKMGIPII